jgi:hypothetical protein
MPYFGIKVVVVMISRNPAATRLAQSCRQITPRWTHQQMNTLVDTVLFPENLERERCLDERVRFIDGRHDDELLVAIDNKVVASVELAPQRMVVRDVESTLIGYFDCPPSGVKQAVLSYCARRNLADEL